MKKIVTTLTALAGITFMSGCAYDDYDGHYAYGCGSPGVYSCRDAYGYGSPSAYGYDAYGYVSQSTPDAAQLSPGGPAGEAVAIQLRAELAAGREAAEAPGREAAEAAGQQPTGETP